MGRVTSGKKMAVEVDPYADSYWSDDTDYYGEEAYSYWMDNNQRAVVMKEPGSGWLAMIGDSTSQIANGMAFYADEVFKDKKAAQMWVYVMDEQAAGKKYNPDGSLRSGNIESWRKASKKTAADDIAYDNNIDSSNGLPADYMYFESDADDEDVYGPVVSIMFDYGKDMYETCYFNNPEKVGLYSGEFDQEPDAVEYFKTRSEAKKWGEDKLRQPMLAFASKKQASSHRLARGFHSRWNESDMYDFVKDAVDDINRHTYSDIMARNLNSYEGDDGEVYTFNIITDYFSLYVEVDGTNVSISCDEDPSLDQAWDFDEDYSSRDLANDLFNIASDAEDVFIEMSEEDEEDSDRFASARTAAISDEDWENYKKRMQEQDAKYAKLFESFEKFMQEMIEGIRGTSNLYRVTNIKASNNRGDYPRITGSFIVRIGKKLRVRVYLCVSQKGADEDWAEYVEMSMGPTNEEMAGEYGGEDFTDSDKAVEWAVENLSLYQERYPELVDPELGEQLKSFESQKGWELFF